LVAPSYNESTHFVYFLAWKNADFLHEASRFEKEKLLLDGVKDPGDFAEDSFGLRLSSNRSWRYSQ